VASQHQSAGGNYIVRLTTAINQATVARQARATALTEPLPLQYYYFIIAASPSPLSPHYTDHNDKTQTSITYSVNGSRQTDRQTDMLIAILASTYTIQCSNDHVLSELQVHNTRTSAHTVVYNFTHHAVDKDWRVQNSHGLYSTTLVKGNSLQIVITEASFYINDRRMSDTNVTAGIRA